MGELNLTIDLEEVGRQSMYDELCERFNKQAIDQTLKQQVVQNLTQMFDNRDNLDG